MRRPPPGPRPLAPTCTTPSPTKAAASDPEANVRRHAADGLAEGRPGDPAARDTVLRFADDQPWPRRPATEFSSAAPRSASFTLTAKSRPFARMTRHSPPRSITVVPRPLMR